MCPRNAEEVSVFAAYVSHGTLKAPVMCNAVQSTPLTQAVALPLLRRYAELQEAHFQQSKALADLEAQPDGARQLKATIKSQEAVIGNLERLLAQAVARGKEVGPLEGLVQQLRWVGGAQIVEHDEDFMS